MTQPDAQIICRKTPYGDVCEWRGGRFAEMNLYDLGRRRGRPIEAGEVIEVGHLRLRVVQWPLFREGAPFDTAMVMLESPHAQLHWLYREKAEMLVRALSNFEMRIWGAIRGFMWRPLPEGELLPVTSKIADRLL